MDEIVSKIFAPGKGILAADESFPSIAKRFEPLGIESREDTRWAYRNILLTTAGIEEAISGVILFDETIRQKTHEGVPFPKYLQSMGIVPGIKVDMGTRDLPHFEREKYTAGIDGLPERLKEYFEMGARFTKWRAVFTISDDTPSDFLIETNVGSLSLFASLSQEAGLIPIVEPEVLMDGSHDLKTCEDTTTRVHTRLFSALQRAKVNLSGLILKTNMILPGKDSTPVRPEHVAGATLRAFAKSVPMSIGGIVFLSGGLSEEVACEYLNAIEIENQKEKNWKMTFSFGRALQNSALRTWEGKAENVESTQKVFLERVLIAKQAVLGQYRKK